jgi:D-glycero-D-manno-heptose 1,7-bisphosphate phosphatase
LRRAVFVDRDGVINELVRDPVSGEPESPLRAQDVALTEGAAVALAQLRAAGYALVGVSNQPAAAKGRISTKALLEVHERVVELLAADGVRFDAFELCLHHPEGIVPDLSGPCDCRKPQPGMLLRAARALEIDLGASWMVGDTDGDIAAGRAAGCRTILVEHPGSAHKRKADEVPDGTVADLSAAVASILGTPYPR